METYTGAGYIPNPSSSGAFDLKTVYSNRTHSLVLTNGKLAFIGPYSVPSHFDSVLPAAPKQIILMSIYGHTTTGMKLRSGFESV